MTQIVMIIKFTRLASIFQNLRFDNHFQRDVKYSDGFGYNYLWHHQYKNRWQFSLEQNFKDKNTHNDCMMYKESSGQEKQD